MPSKRPLNMDEKQNSGNVMHSPMDSYVCGINTSSQVLSFYHVYFSRTVHVPVEF